MLNGTFVGRGEGCLVGRADGLGVGRLEKEIRVYENLNISYIKLIIPGWLNH